MAENGGLIFCGDDPGTGNSRFLGCRRVRSGCARNDNLLGWAYSVFDEEEIGMRLLLNWVLSALAVWIVAQLGIGISVQGAKSALIAALVIGFINATIGALLKIITFPLTLVTLGLFWFVINASDAGAGVSAVVSGISGARIPGGVCGRDRAEPGQPAAEGDRDAVEGSQIRIGDVSGNSSSCRETVSPRTMILLRMPRSWIRVWPFARL